MLYKFKKTYFKDEELKINELIYLSSHVKEKIIDYTIMSSSMRTLEDEDELPTEVKKDLETKEEVRYKYLLDEDTANQIVENYGEELYKVNTDKFEKVENMEE